MAGTNQSDTSTQLNRWSSYFSIAVILIGALLISVGLMQSPFSMLIALIGILLIVCGILFFLVSAAAKKNDASSDVQTHIPFISENRIKISESRFGSMIEHAVDIISLLDENSRLLYINGAIEKITGYSADEMLNTIGLNIVHPDDVEDAKNMFAKLFANPGKPVFRTARLLHKNGSIVWVEGILINLLHDTEVRAIISNYRDVTERKMAEEQINAGEKKIQEHT